jgi:ABC-type sugar transport system ATPase subunit
MSISGERMPEILELRHITKVYPGVKALDDFSMSFEAGKIHSVMGENGAGKSTLIKIITGAVEATAGTVVIDGKAFQKLTPALSKAQGVGAIYQEFNLVPTMSAAENIFLGRNTGSPIMPDFKYMRRRTAEIMGEFGVDIDPRGMVGELSTAHQQLVEIAKAVSGNCKILIMDEPTASIAVTESATLFRIIHALKAKGTTII